MDIFWLLFICTHCVRSIFYVWFCNTILRYNLWRNITARVFPWNLFLLKKYYRLVSHYIIEYFILLWNISELRNCLHSSLFFIKYMCIQCETLGGKWKFEPKIIFLPGESFALNIERLEVEALVDKIAVLSFWANCVGVQCNKMSKLMNVDLGWKSAQVTVAVSAFKKFLNFRSSIVELWLSLKMKKQLWNAWVSWSKKWMLPSYLGWRYHFWVRF